MNESSSSRGPSAAKAKVKGIPNACWCGAPITTMLSKSENNLYRRFYRCSYAASEMLFNDTHVFKWVEDALVNEIETLHNSVDRVENEVMEKLENTLMDLVENFIMEKVEYLIMQKVEKLVKEKVEQLVKEKVEHVVMEKLDNLVMEKLDSLVMEKFKKNFCA